MHRSLAASVIGLSLFASLPSSSDDLALLPPGQHLSVLPFAYFEPPVPATEQALEALLSEAVSRGMTTVSYELDWHELEPAPVRARGRRLPVGHSHP
jgi:hypothetical protein